MQKSKHANFNLAIEVGTSETSVLATGAALCYKLSTRQRNMELEKMANATFDKLWSSFPDRAKLQSTCFNKQNDSQQPFSNYCAILLSECFIRSGVNLSRFSGTKCWSHAGTKHALLATDLANWLVSQTPPGFGGREKILPGSFQDLLKGRTGVIYFKDYWQRGQESFSARSGDHIDLWNENEITSSSMLYRSIIEWFGFVSDLNKSREVWFWEVN